MTYSLALTQFTDKQCKKIATVIEKVILPKMGINRNIPKAVLYGPQEYGGLAFPTIETMQDQKGISHWIKFLQWGRKLVKTSKYYYLKRN